MMFQLTVVGRTGCRGASVPPRAEQAPAPGSARAATPDRRMAAFSVMEKWRSSETAQ